MYKTYKMAEGEVRSIDMSNYAEDEYICASLDFLGCNKNSHRINISEEVFRKCADSVLGKFLVAEVKYGDATTHSEGEIIQGYIPREQEVRFIRNKEGYLRGVVDVVASKYYAPDFCNIFKKSNHTRAVSVEMSVDEVDNGDGSTTAKSFNIIGVTVLGMLVNPSSPGSNIDIKRFAETDVDTKCEDYYKTVQHKLFETDLDMFVKNKKTQKDENFYNINEDELKETPWGDVDKSELRDIIMGASNRNELVEKVYLKVLDGWEEAPSENLKYPVMEFDNGTFYYNKFALASALAYAKKNDESDVISKIAKLYEKFNLAEKDEEESMSKEKFKDENQEALEQEELETSEEEKEQDENLECDEEMEEESQEKEEEKPVEEDKEDKSEDEEEDDNKSTDEKVKELEDIIMAKEAELEELRAFKEAQEDKEKEFVVQQTLEEIRECVDTETFEALKEEGAACKLADIDGWKNKAKSLAFDANSQKKEVKMSIWSMSVPAQNIKKSTGLWD